MLLTLMAGVKASHTATTFWMQVLKTSISMKGKCSSSTLTMGSM